MLMKKLCLVGVLCLGLMFLVGCGGGGGGDSFAALSGSSGGGGDDGGGDDGGGDDGGGDDVNPVVNPEPSSILLMTSGLISLAAVYRRKKNKRKA